MHRHDKVIINRTNGQTGGKYCSTIGLLEFNISTNLLTQMTRIDRDYI
jgi:hypothetical protein